MNRKTAFSFVAACLLTATTLYGLPASAASSDEEIAQLKAQLKMMTERLETLEKQQAAQQQSIAATTAPAPKSASGEGEPVVGGSMPGSFKLPGTDTSIKIGGYAKLDAIYNTNGYESQFANFATIPINGTPRDKMDGNFSAHARQSRLNLETRTPTSYGELKTFFEVDFFGSARGNATTTNGEGLQLRHAYGQIGRVLAGQTWSNFMDMDAFPESLDYLGPAGLTFVRQAQLRYTDKLSDKFTYALALEAPFMDFASDIVPDTDVNASDMPDFTAKLQYNDTFGHIAVRGLARKLDAADVTGQEDIAFGWGLGLSGKINISPDDSFLFQGVYGVGVGHYLFDVAISQNGNTYVGNHLDPRPAWGGYVAYQHKWTDEWRSNFIAGYTGIDNGNAAFYATSPNKEIMSGHANLIWSPVPSFRVGVEYMHGRRTLENGQDGDIDRFQTSVMYLF